MSQNDFVIDNQTASAVRSDLNSAFQALASLNSGTSEPATKYANMLWYDTTNNILKMRNEANNAWVNLLYLDQINALVHILENTEVANTSGTLIGKLGVHADSVWTTGTNTEKRLVSPAQINAAIQALSFGTVWTDRLASRAFATTYQNTNGYKLMVHVSTAYSASITVSASSDMSSPVVNAITRGTVLVPANYYYRVTDDSSPQLTNSITIWSELDNG